MSSASKKIPYPIKFDYVMRRPAFATFCPTDYVDISERPILEGRSIFHRPSEKDYGKCPYIGSRLQHPKSMNIAALRSFGTMREIIIESVKSLSYQLRRSSQLNIQAPTLLDIYRVAYSGYKSPSFWTLKYCRDENPGLRIPPEYSIISKFSHGLTHLLIYLSSNQAKSLLESWTAQELYDYADKYDLFIGRNEVCAGPPKLIQMIIDVILEELSTSGDSYKSNPIDETLIRFGSLCQHMETISFIYETMRCTALILLSNNKNSAVYSRPIELFSRHAIPQGIIAMNIAKSASPLAHDFIRGLIVRTRAIREHDPIASMLNSQIDAANKLYNSLIAADGDINECWDVFESLVINSISFINRKISSELSLEGEVLTISKRDMEIFFGQSPPSVFS
jgi:hypothetical protein